MFGKNKDVSLNNPSSAPESEPVFAPVVEQTEVVDLSAERMALMERCGQLVNESTAAFNRELKLAREKGLSVEDQEAFMKSLWAERKIPRVLGKGLRSHSTGVAVVKPEKVDEIKIFELEQFNEPHINGDFNSPMVDRDFDRVPNPENPDDEPVMFMGTLDGYFGSEIDQSFMPPVSADSLDRLQKMTAVLEEASVLDIEPVQQQPIIPLN